MRRDSYEVIVAWAIGVLSIAAACALLVLMTGCGFKYEVAGASSDVESALLAYTDTYAAKLGVTVRGEIATNRTASQEANDAAGWYAAGIAYYYRPAVAEFVTLIDGQCPAAPRCELASGVAAHETCHALFPQHDIAHWCCQKKLGVRPTYPPPTTVEGQWPTCE